MDADYNYNETNEQSEFGGRKRKGKSRFASAVSHKKPVFNPGLFCMVIGGSKLYQNLTLGAMRGFRCRSSLKKWLRRTSLRPSAEDMSTAD